MNTNTDTSYEYDDNGYLTGVVTTITITEAIDPDGDGRSYSWIATDGSIGGSGPTATWTRDTEGPATVTVTASDGRGGIATFTIDFSYY